MQNLTDLRKYVEELRSRVLVPVLFGREISHISEQTHGGPGRRVRYCRAVSDINPLCRLLCNKPEDRISDPDLIPVCQMLLGDADTVDKRSVISAEIMEHVAPILRLDRAMVARYRKIADTEL